AHRAPADLIFMVSSFIREHGPTGDAVDVTDLVNPANFAVGATQGTQLLSPVTNASKIYGGIYTGKVKPGFWYRQSFFTQHSLSPPTTWAQFQSLLSDIGNISGVSAPIVSGDGVGWPLSDVTEHFIATYGGAAMPGVVFAADYMFIPTYTTHLGAAKQLFSYLTSVEGQSAQVAQGGHLATRIGVPDSAYPPGDLDVAKSLAGKEILPDLDDTIGGHFQTTFWNELIGLWTSTDPAAALGPALTAILASVPP